MMYQKQRGSALIFIVGVVAVVLLLILIGNIAVYTKDVANQVPESKSAYLESSEKAIALWYRKNALRIDSPDPSGTCLDFPDESALFREMMITPEFGARIAISPCQNVPPLVYRTVAIWIPPAGVADTVIANPWTAKGNFMPTSSEVQYRVVSGQIIESYLVAETNAQLQEMARTLELRFKSKIDNDPSRDIGYNHFKAGDCTNVGMDEIPCAGDAANPYVVLDDATFSALKLAELTSMSHNTNRDAWGQFIIFNNLLDNGNVCLPEGDLDNSPPYRMMLQTITPWGTEITICPVQPVN